MLGEKTVMRENKTIPLVSDETCFFWKTEDGMGSGQK